MKLDALVEKLSTLTTNSEELLFAIEEASILGMNHLYISIRRGGARAILALHINPFNRDLISLIAMIPVGCGERSPSLEEANKLAKSLEGLIMVVGECGYVLSGYDGSKDIAEFLSNIFSKIPGDSPDDKILIEGYSYDLFSEYQEDLSGDLS
ncbi:MAG: hypothetical protein QXQ57_05820 [Sulfolobales archaeon]